MMKQKPFWFQPKKFNSMAQWLGKSRESSLFSDGSDCCFQAAFLGANKKLQDICGLYFCSKKKYVTKIPFCKKVSGNAWLWLQILWPVRIHFIAEVNVHILYEQANTNESNKSNRRHANTSWEVRWTPQNTPSKHLSEKVWLDV